MENKRMSACGGCASSAKKIVYSFIIASLVLSFAPALTFAQDSITDDSDDVVCALDAMECSDGSYVSRIAPTCEFAECPEEPACPAIFGYTIENNLCVSTSGCDLDTDNDFYTLEDCKKALEENVDKCAVSDVIACKPDQMLHMVVDVSWGNVLDLPENKKETNFDGSISLSGDQGHVSLIRTVLFDRHNSNRDHLNGKGDPVSWNSLIYGHWDGVSVAVSGKAGDSLTVQTSQGSITKTIEELYQSPGLKIVEDVGEGREIVIKVYRYKKRTFLLQLLWGGGHKGAKVDFTGSAVINSGAEGKNYKTVRFEPSHGDEITATTKTSAEWNSYTYGGYDGILARIVFDKDIDKDDTITINFASDVVEFSNTYSLIDLYHNRITKEILPVSINCIASGDVACGDRSYTLRLAVKRHPNGKLVKVRGKSAVYKLEDDTKRPILSAGSFQANGYKWDDVEEITQDELDTYADGESVNYPDGSLVKGSGPKVYLISNGQKRHIANEIAFNGLGYNWKNIMLVGDAELSEIDTTDSLDNDSDYPDGSLVRVEGTKGVYLVEGGTLKPITSADTFLSNGYKWSQVQVVPIARKNRLVKLRTGKSLAYPDGTLIKGTAPVVYIIDKGEKREISTENDFNSLNLKWTGIKSISDSAVASYETGNDVVGGDI